MTLLALLACAPTAPVDIASDEPQVRVETEEAFILVEREDIAHAWSAAEDWELSRVSVLGDITGDGVPDAAVVAYGDNPSSPPQLTLIVEGPLRRNLTLPGDEMASFALATAAFAADTSGNGVNELLVWADDGWDSELYLIDGPVHGDVQAALVGTKLPRDLFLDANADGVLDRIHLIRDKIRFHWGPLANWYGRPNLIMDVSCGEVVATGGWFEEEKKGIRAGVGEVLPLADIDGDGRRELWVDVYGFECGAWQMPLPPNGGSYVAEDDSEAQFGVPRPDIVDDQTGDGLPDAWEDLHFSLDLYAMSWLQFDLDGDGFTDFLGKTNWIDGRAGQVVVQVSGGPDLHTQTLRRGWNVPGVNFGEDHVFVDDGPAILVSDYPDILVLDLGP